MSASREGWNVGAWTAAVVCAWLIAWRHLSTEWNLNEQYQFGWGIPFAFAWIIWRRWETPAEARQGALPLALAFACVGWLLMACGIVLQWRDPIWRMTGALLAMGAVFLTAALFYRMGGAPMVRRHAFSLAFSCLAVPWPVRIDQWITLRLLRFVTGLSVALLGAAGIPALEHGNLIELRTGIVGIEEACSGISSLQASLVASIFLGEYFCLPVPRRLVLGIGGLLACMGANCLRVLSLVLVAHRWGGPAAERWHNNISGTATVVSFLCLGLIAYILAVERRASQRTLRALMWPKFPGRDGWAVLSSYIGMYLGMWVLFHPTNPTAASERPNWTLACRDLPSGWSAAPVAPAQTAAASLHFTRWESCLLQSPEGWSAQVTHLFWNSSQHIPGTAFYHTPALCLSGIGWETAAETETWTLELHGRRLVVAEYHLESPERKLVIAIQSLSVSGDTQGFINDLSHPASSSNRFALLWRGPARRVDEEILAYMPDLGSSDLQREAFTELLNLTLAPTSAN